MPKRDATATPGQTAAQKAALAKGRANKLRMSKEARDRGGNQTAKDRWAALLSGQLSMQELDDKEVSKMRVRNADGTFGGKRRHLPSHIYQQFQQEQLRRFHSKLRKGLDKVPEVIVDILLDPDANNSDRLKAAQMLQDRVLGKSPETVRIEGVSGFDKMLSDAIGIDRADLDEELKDLS